MTTGELETICGAILTGFGVLGAAVRWSAGIIKGVAGRIVKAIDESTEAQRGTAAELGKFTAAVARFEVKLDEAREASLKTAEAVEEIADEVSGVHDGPPEPPPVPRRSTPVRGLPVEFHPPRRAATKGGR